MLPPPLLPWLEANQGLVAIVTLAIALLLAFLEWLRANNQDLRRRKEFQTAILALLDPLIEATDKASKAVGTWVDQGGNTEGDTPALVHREWRILAEQTREAFEALLPASPPAADVIMALVTARSLLEHHAITPPVFRDAWARTHLASTLTGLKGAREAFAKAMKKELGVTG